VALFTVKKTSPGSGRLMIYHGKGLVDWECGDRDHLTLKRLLDRLDRWNPLLYCTDHYEAYAEVIPSHRLFMGKDKTVEIEQNNGARRH
jgi:IS1 family transposase